MTALVACELGSDLIGEQIGDEEPDVVPGGRVLRTRITEPDDQPRAAGQGG